MTRICLALALVVAACTEFPEVEGRASEAAKAAPFPTLQPIDSILGGDTAPPRLDEDDVDALLARVNALKARANRLRGPVVDGATKARMQQALAN